MSRAQEIVIDVEGMTCEHCEQRVEKALSAVEGVVSARASRAEKRAVVTADPGRANEEKLKAAVEQAGYRPGDVFFPE